MLRDLLSRLTDGAEVVAGNGALARQLETGLCNLVLAMRGADAMPSLVESYSPWQQRLWREFDTSGRQLLTRSQSQALWRRTISDSEDAARLIGCDSASGWAADAWARLWRYELDPARLAATADDADFGVFLRWAGQYRASLDRNGWIDAELASAELVSAPSLACDPPRTVIWAGMDEIAPAQRSLAARLVRAGWNVSAWEPPGPEATCRRIQFRDETEELAAATQWAAGTLARNGRQRLALVVPKAETRAYSLERLLSRAFDPASDSLASISRRSHFDPLGQPPLRQPVIGAAFNALELTSHRGGFTELSRWLRSPFFSNDPEDELDRSVLERDLRTEIVAQLGFRDAFQRGGLAQRMRRSSPGTERRLRRALEVLTKDTTLQRATPTRWVAVWQQVLTELGWTGAHSDATALAAWDAALNDFCLLTPILGRLPLTEALSELERVIASPRAGGPVPAFGLTLLARPEDLAAGYDAVWMVGVTDSEWPRTEAPNPLLPLRLQTEHDMPGASPTETLSRSERLLVNLKTRSRELILSWPSVVNESLAAPSPLIGDIPLDERHAGAAAAAMPPRGPGEELADAAPPLAGKEIPGGASTLTLQARSPLRAFVESRLGGRPLETVRRGLSARQRGVVTHAALERFLRRLPSRADLAAWAPSDRRDFARACASRALTSAFGAAEEMLGVVVDLERERLVNLLDKLVDADLARSDFRIEAVETSRQIEIAGYRIACRIDRVDSLTEGGTAVIDLKTGRRASPGDWLRDRLRDAQLPLYAQALDAGVTALVLAVATVDGVSFKGLWTPPDAFPGRPIRLPDHRDWPGQLAVWAAQLETLIAEYAQGDVRILLGDELEVAGNLAPLSRLCEQRSLAEGWLGSWELR